MPALAPRMSAMARACKVRHSVLIVSDLRRIFGSQRDPDCSRTVPAKIQPAYVIYSTQGDMGDNGTVPTRYSFFQALC